MNENCVMVFVTPQNSCARLIEAGAQIAVNKNLKLIVVSVTDKFDSKTSDALGNLYNLVKGSGAEMKLYVNSEPVLTAAVAAKRYKTREIVTGFPGENSGMFINGLHSLIPDIPITMVDSKGTQYRIENYTEETSTMSI